MAMRPRGKRKGEQGYGHGQVAIATGQDVLLDEEEMVERLLDSLNAPDYRPPTLPAVAVELMELSQQADVEIGAVVALLEQDAMITGRVLKLVRSPVYRGTTAVTSLRDALMRVGLQTVRDLVMEIAMNMKVFRSRDYADTMELLRRHSSMTAHFSRIVCNYSPIEGEFAFMAGLLHDVGIAGTLLALSEGNGSRRAPALMAIWPAVDRVHPRAAEIMADHWSLPPDIKMAIGAHHVVMIQGHAHPLAATIAIADELAHELGYGVVPKRDDEDAMLELQIDCERSHIEVDRCQGKTLERARESLQLTEAQMGLIRADAVRIAEDIASGV
jgi:HD-like signal output (HDOD) protein